LDANRVTIMSDFEIDENYIPTLGMQMVVGRNFSRDFPTDSTGIIVNETAARMFGFKEPMKDMLYRPDYTSQSAYQKVVAYHLVGIVKDFNFNNMHQQVGPLVMHLGYYPDKVSLRISTHNIAATINNIEHTWKAMAPGQPFSYSFMDADFNNLYNAEQQTGKLFMTFAMFAIFIACLGLFGLVTYAAEQRTKEIGIRKVLGAGVSGIVAMISKDFLKLVLIASLVAFPVAWWAMNKWLQDFAYRISIAWWVFALAAIIALLIAVLT